MAKRKHSGEHNFEICILAKQKSGEEMGRMIQKHMEKTTCLNQRY